MVEEKPESMDYVELQFIAETLLGLYSLVAKYGGMVILYPSGDNVMRAYIPSREMFDKFAEEIVPEVEWTNFDELKKNIEKVKDLLGGDLSI